MSNQSYGLFCPLAMACEILEPRWTLMILNELWGGATRFNEIKRALPGISATLLSRRLKELEKRGLVERVEDAARGTVDYIRTPMAVELEPALMLLGEWAYRNIEADVALHALKPDYLIWNMRRKIDSSELPQRRVVVRFHFNDCKKEEATYWVIAKPGAAVDLCIADPGFDVDLFIEAHMKAMASVWMGYSTLQAEISRDRIWLSGNRLLMKTIDKWLLKLDPGKYSMTGYG